MNMSKSKDCLTMTLSSVAYGAFTVYYFSNPLSSNIP